ncbi:ATP-binding protein [Streptomyces olivaceus]|uniref:ATP-binding protein n=1 Tax=Streptomyces olivaceus TaxID=47716 RepID=UPI0036B1A61A
MNPHTPHRPADEPLTVSFAYDGDPTRVPEARAVARRFIAAVQEAFGQSVRTHEQDTVEQVVGELLANAFLHAPGRALLALTATAHTVQVTVWDSAQTVPVLCRGDAERGQQYGLEIVTALSERMSVHREPFGKRVSVTVPLRKQALGDFGLPHRPPDDRASPEARGPAPAGSPHGPAPSNAFVPVPGCWTCTILHSVALAAWNRDDGLGLHHWLSVTASGMQHRMDDHGLPPQEPAKQAP